MYGFISETRGAIYPVHGQFSCWRCAAGWHSSFGQISGRRSERDTAPFVARSIANAEWGEIEPPLIQP